MIVKKDISLKPYNTFGLDVKAESFVECEDRSELVGFIKNDLKQYASFIVLGGGSNVLFKEDYQGLVIRLRTKGVQIVEESEDVIRVKAEAGEDWDEFVAYCVDHGWGGLENLSLIPGNVGTSPIQNIGAYGVEIKDVMTELEALDIATGEIIIFKNSDCDFGYRQSVFKSKYKGQYIILSVTFNLSKRSEVNTSYGAIETALKESGIEEPTIKDVRDAICFIRDSKLPDTDKLGNAGSFFKNPVIAKIEFDQLMASYPNAPFYKVNDLNFKIPAGWLIEQCGWKGKREGNVGMHEKQALVLVNYGEATGQELIDHAHRVIESVKQKFGIDIEPEVNIV